MAETIDVAFRLPDGTVVSGEARVGESLMRAAQSLGVNGIVAECGGMCSCSTCHCHVDPAWAERLEPMSDMEEGMLEIAIDPDETSRLSCQIVLRPDLDGLTVSVPRAQA